jgi:hypothetical protein
LNVVGPAGHSDVVADNVSATVRDGPPRLDWLTR